MEATTTEFEMTTDLRITLKRKLPALKRLFAKNPLILAVWLFGSQADGTATRDSDIDFGVLYARAVTLDEHLTLEAAMDEILQSGDFDVVDAARVDLRLRHRIISGKLLYERDPVRVADFVEEILRLYPDYFYDWKRFNQDYFEGMRQDYARFRPRQNRRTSQNHQSKSTPTRRRARARD